MSKNIERVFDQHGKLDKLIFNGNFRYLVGGPIWNKDQPGVRAYFRKYIGVKGEGDFTLITSHPLQILDQYEIVHSHGPFRDWHDAVHFPGYQQFCTVRYPVGILNSACHSINALASEYIQLDRPDIDVERCRQNLAYYKLTDERFFRALMGPLHRGLVDLKEHYDRFYCVRWEDVITEPKATILGIVKAFDLPVSEAYCEKLWQGISYRNLTGAHKHNYRVGKAYVGDEREAIVNEHIEIMRAEGFDELSEFFGYGPLTYLDESEYTLFQRTVSECLKRGEVFDPLDDRVLFDLAFNKSNVDFEGFGFRMHEWRSHTRIERSNIADSRLELAVSEISEQTVGLISELFEKLMMSLEAPVPSLNGFNLMAMSMSESFPDVDVEQALAQMQIILREGPRQQLAS